MDVLLYATENPRNLGSIIRTSVGLGLTKIHLYDEHRILENPEAAQQTDAVCRRNRRNYLDIVSVQNPIEFIDSYENKYATLLSPRSKRLGISDNNFEFAEDGLVIFGCESYGLPRAISRRDGVKKFVIPTVDTLECFGLAEAYSIIVFECLRQHRKLPEYRK